MELRVGLGSPPLSPLSSHPFPGEVGIDDRREGLLD